MTLTEYFDLYKTDKGTIGHGSEAHNYGKTYEPFLEQYIGQGINFCEIGVLNGDSLRAWRDYLQNATIVGIDSKVKTNALDEGYTVLQATQADPSTIKQALGQYSQFDIILDDGSHEAKHQQECLAALFGNLKVGGLYIIEDLHCPVHPWKPSHRWNTFKWEDRTDSTLDLFTNNLDKSYYINAEQLAEIRENVRILEVTSKVAIIQKLK